MVAVELGAILYKFFFFLCNFFIMKNLKKFAKLAKKVIGNDINENAISMAKNNS